jgi:beta-phosphoglucomutase family hydrolase
VFGLGLPDGVRACLFDLDGVLTSTAVVHAAAWKQMFDGYLRERAERTGEPSAPFDIATDYVAYVDGKPRNDGTRDFLASRRIVLSDDEVRELGLRKNEIVLRLIREGGVEAYPGSVDYLGCCREAGLARVVVSSSTNCRDVLVAAGVIDLVDGYIDGIVAEQRRLRGKPAPDTFLAGAALAGVDRSQAAVFEDALAGVEAGRAGGFRYVVGVDRVGHADALRAHGADIVVGDLRELLSVSGSEPG